MPMKIQAIETFPKIHLTPLASVRIENFSVIVEADDEHGRRIQFVMRPYQALRMITADCYLLLPGVTITPRFVYEVVDSEWVADLKRNLSMVDSTATFLNKTHHYLFPLQDEFLEVVAWDVKVSVKGSV